MTAQQQNPEAIRIGEEWSQALERLSAQDERLLTTLRLLGEAIDPRYEMKGIRMIIARSLADPAFRARVLDDADAVMAELRGHIELPENVRVRCVENTEDYLTIVLPPPYEAMSERSQQMQDFILSRTSADFDLAAGARDDNDITPIHFLAENGVEAGINFGDRRVHDHH